MHRRSGNFHVKSETFAVCSSHEIFFFLTVDGYNMDKCLEVFLAFKSTNRYREPGIAGCIAVAIRSQLDIYLRRSGRACTFIR